MDVSRLRKKVLIADDKEMIRTLIRDTIESDGYEILEADNGDTALALALDHKPDLVILDIMMPGKIGYEVCIALKDNPLTADTYVMFITGRTSPALFSTASRAGGDEVIVKPFDPIELKEKIKNVLFSRKAGASSVAHRSQRSPLA